MNMTRRNNYFKTFCSLSRAFGTTDKKEELLELIVDSAIETMEGKAACLFLADEQQDVFYTVSQKGLSDNYLHANVMKARRLVEGLAKVGHLSFTDATTDPRLENHDAKKAEGIASILTVPVTVSDNIIGVLSLYTAKQREFSEDEIEFLRALADQGGIAIEHARLLERIRDNSRLYLKLASSINSSLDIKDVLHTLTEEVVLALEMKGATIRLLNKDTDELELVDSYGLSDTFLNKGPVLSAKSQSENFEGELVYIKDATTDKRVQYRDAMKNEGIASILAVPINSRKEVIGVLRLFSAEQREFPEETILLVKALAHQGALAIQNASMYLKLEVDKKSLEGDIWSHRQWF